MPIGYVLKQVGFKVGLDPAKSGDRAVLLRLVNEAAQELYDQADTDECMMEQIFKVDGDQQIALPPHVGPLRAMREYNTHVPWHLYNWRPRYNQFNWKDRWRSWRLKGLSPLRFPLVNQGKVVVVVPGDKIEEPHVVVTVTGATDTASGVSENIEVVGNKVESQTAFTNIIAVKKNRVNLLDIQLQDLDGNILCQLPNNMLQMRYRIVDVSLYPWSNTDLNNADHTMEVLFKQALPWFENDEDEYPSTGYDNILVNKVLQLWMEEQGKVEEALAYDAKATRSLARKIEDSRRGIEEEAALVENSHDTLLPRNRPMGPSRYMGQIYY